MVTNPNFKPGVGRLVTDRFDFQKHIEGIDFKHQASGINVNPGINGATDLQSSLNNIAAFMASGESVSQGFITVGDGYDAWHAADGNINFDPTTPTLDTLLNPIFDAIYNNTALPPGYDRIKYGGIVVIKSGTYVVANPIRVPPGITLLGEGYGTKIVNISGLQISSTPGQPAPVGEYQVTNVTVTNPVTVTVQPAISNLINGQTVSVNNISGTVPANGIQTVSNVSSTSFSTTFSLVGVNGTGDTWTNDGYGVVTTGRPIFIILTDLNRSVNDGAVDASAPFMFSRETKIMNIVIADNFVEAPFLGDSDYRLPQNFFRNNLPTNVTNPDDYTSLFAYVNPIISQQTGSSLVIDNVSLMGRANASGGLASQATYSAIKLDKSNGALNGTILRVNNSFIDGFAYPVYFDAPAGSLDYLEVSNCKVRAYGVPIYGPPEPPFFPNGLVEMAATIFLSNDNNVRIINNTLYADSFFPTLPGTLNVDLFVQQSVLDLSSRRVSGVPTLQNRGHIVVSSNTLNVDKTTSSLIPEDTALGMYIILPSGSQIPNYATALAYGNTFQNNFKIQVDNVITTVDNTNTLTTDTATIGTGNLGNLNVGPINCSGNSTFTGANIFTPVGGPNVFNNEVDFTGHTYSTAVHYSINTNITTTNYVVDSLTAGFPHLDYCMLIPTYLGACTVVLPTASNAPGRVLVIKDIGKASLTNTITIYTQLSEQFEAGISRFPNSPFPLPYGDQYIITTPFASVTLIAGAGGNWFII